MNLKKYLRQQQIRYRTFAENLGITEQSLKNIVAGTKRPGLLLALKIEQVTNGQITPAQLVDYYTKITEIKRNKKNLQEKG